MYTHTRWQVRFFTIYDFILIKKKIQKKEGNF